MKAIYLFFATCICFGVHAQTIVSINGEDIDIEEFKEIYEKTVDRADYSSESLQQFTTDFVKQQLKLAEAEEKGILNDPKVQQQINEYQNELIENVFNKELLKDLKEEAYTRLQEEICASHILIHVKNNPSPIDTVLARKKAIKLRNRILSGEDFGYIAEKNSADMNTKYKDGSLGCFTTLQLNNYTLENAIYGLEEGELSQPIRTDLGYHIIKINERRPSSGLVKAKQLFARANNLQDNEQNYMAKRLINDAYSRLRSGIDFETVADSLLSHWDEVDVSSENIDWFSVGTYEADFENAIFDLDEKGDFSRPVKTSIGWHIFMLEDRKKLPDFEDIETALAAKIKEDERFYQSKLDFSKELKANYDFERKEENIELFIDQVAPGIGIIGWQIPSIYDLNLPLFTIENRAYPARGFVNFVKGKHRNDEFHSFEYYYNNYESNQLLQYHKEQLINEDEQLKAKLQEFKRNIIISRLMEEELWNGSPPSTQVLQSFYRKNKKQYNYPERVKMLVYTNKKSDFITNMRLEKFLEDNRTSRIDKLMRKNEELEVTERILPIIEAKKLDDDLVDPGEVVEVKKDDVVEYLVSKEILPGKSTTFREVEDQVLKDYQKTKEKDWFEQMKQKHKVVVHKNVLKSLIRS